MRNPFSALPLMMGFGLYIYHKLLTVYLFITHKTACIDGYGIFYMLHIELTECGSMKKNLAIAQFILTTYEQRNVFLLFQNALKH